jgi:hypothetical protein
MNGDILSREIDFVDSTFFSINNTIQMEAKNDANPV